MRDHDKLLHYFHSSPLWDKSLIEEQSPIVIAGPCSAESRSQVLATAWALKKEGVRIFRAGVWKPRTYPSSFEGIGEEALLWLQEVRNETQMLVGCEIGSASQATLALKYQMDYVWIGARTTSSPFAISEIAEALKGSDITILVKNPLSPSMDLWKGAIIRFINAGLYKIGVLHRGFDIGTQDELRYPPLWEEVLRFKNEVPGIPFYFDPSHIAGSRQFLHPLIQKAKDLGYDGFMIESHLQPELAWSDANQQIHPELINYLLNTPVLAEEILDLYRKELDHLDEQFISLVAKRRELSKAIGMIKASQGLTPFQEDRYQRTKKKFALLSSKYNIPVELSEKLFEEIHHDSANLQELLNNEDN